MKRFNEGDIVYIKSPEYLKGRLGVVKNNGFDPFTNQNICIVYTVKWGLRLVLEKNLLLHKDASKRVGGHLSVSDML